MEDTKLYLEKDLISLGYKKISNILYSKEISKKEIDQLIKKFYELKSKKPQERHIFKKKLFDNLDIYRLYKKTGYLHISNFSVTRTIKKSGTGYTYSFSHETTKKLTVKSRLSKNGNQTNNISIVRKFNMGDENKELTFIVDGHETNMERRRVSILKEENYSPNFELHHIVTIDNSSRDKADHDPSKWLRTTDLTHFVTYDEISDISINDKTISINGRMFPQETVKIEIINQKLIAHVKQKSAVERVKELLGIMIIPVEEHSVFHKAIGRKENRNMGYSGYNLSCLPHAIRSKENYDNFIDWLCENYKFKSTIFDDFETHIKNLEVDN